MTPRAKRRLWYTGIGLLLVAAAGVWLLGPKQRCVLAEQEHVLYTLDVPMFFGMDKLDGMVRETAERHGFILEIGPTTCWVDALAYQIVRETPLARYDITLKLFARSVDRDKPVPAQVVAVWSGELDRPYLPTAPRGIDLEAFCQDLGEAIALEMKNRPEMPSPPPPDF